MPSTLRIGRDPDYSPIGEKLTPYGNISRLHAEISFTNGSCHIRDLGTMNGTFVDDRKISPHQDVPINSGAKLRFAADLQVTIKEIGGPTVKQKDRDS